MLPKKYVELTVDDLKNGDTIPISGQDLKVLPDYRVYVYKYGLKLFSLPEWIIKFDNEKYLLYSTPNSREVKMVKAVEESSFILVEYAGHMYAEDYEKLLSVTKDS